MDLTTATTALAQLRLPDGYVGSTPQRVDDDPDTYTVHVQGPAGQMLEFTNPDDVAQAQITLNAMAGL